MILAVASCDARVLTLGHGSPVPYHFGTPTLVQELASTERTDNPTLTRDMLEIYFTTARTGATNGDIWFATRSNVSEPFGTSGPVPNVNSDDYETSSAISADGLTLWFGSTRPGGKGGLDIWVSERTSRLAEWSTPVNLVTLNSTAHDIPRPPGQHGLVMPMASTLITAANPYDGNYQTYWATRANTGSPFAAPVAIPELDYRDRSTVDGCLSDDGLTMFFSSLSVSTTNLDGGAQGLDGGTEAVDGGARTADAGARAVDAATEGGTSASKSDLYVAFRRSTSESFTVVQPLTDLNTSADERDPWLSPDGTVLYFTSDRDGVLNIYSVAVLPR